ncbi:MAG: hypothetical protein KDI30_08730 [Pseudomonadales bacterium]|nr:hypothetical protein [Pseudomonadales bacterium]
MILKKWLKVLIFRSMVFLAFFGLIGCVNLDTSARQDFCAIQSLKEVEGFYANKGSERLSGHDVYLSQIFWLGHPDKLRNEHENIQKIQIREEKSSYYAMIEGSVEDKVKIDMRLENGHIIVFSSADFLPSADGGVVVGPQSVSIWLYKDCSGNLVLHKHESIIGLVFMIMPVWNERDHYSIFRALQDTVNE